MSTTPDTYTRHEYTDAEILHAWGHRQYLPGQRGKKLDNLKAFLAALPERPQAQPGPWPGQQEAIDAAMIETARANGHVAFAGDPIVFERSWAKEAPARLAIAQAYDAARPQAAEIAKLNEQLEGFRNVSEGIMAELEKRDAQVAALKAELEKAESRLKPEIEVLHDTISSLKKELVRVKEERDAVEFDFNTARNDVETLAFKLDAAHAVLDGDPSKIIRNAAQGYPEGRAPRELTLAERVQALCKYAADYVEWHQKAESELADLKSSHFAILRLPAARLIAAAKGEGQANSEAALLAIDDNGNPAPVSDEPSEPYHANDEEPAQPRVVPWSWVPSAKAMEVINALSKDKDLTADQVMMQALRVYQTQFVVNEPPRDDKQPDLPLKSEKQPEAPAWILHDGGPCPLKDEEVEEWEIKFRNGSLWTGTTTPSFARWNYKDLNGDIIAYRVLKWKPGFGPEAKAEPAQAWTPAVGDTAKSINWDKSGYKFEPLKVPGIYQMGDKVTLKSGGPVMVVVQVSPISSLTPPDTAFCQWFDGNVFCSQSFPAACLTPAKP